MRKLVIAVLSLIFITSSAFGHGATYNAQDHLTKKLDCSITGDFHPDKVDRHYNLVKDSRYIMRHFEPNTSGDPCSGRPCFVNSQQFAKGHGHKRIEISTGLTVEWGYTSCGGYALLCGGSCDSDDEPPCEEPPCEEKPPCEEPPCEEKPPCEEPPCEEKPPCEEPPCEEKPPCEDPPCEEKPPCEEPPCEDDPDQLTGPRGGIIVHRPETRTDPGLQSGAYRDLSYMAFGRVLVHWISGARISYGHVRRIS